MNPLENKPFQRLTLAGVKAEAFKAYQEKRLTAQSPDREKRICAYREDGCGCAIGVSLSPEVLKWIEEKGYNYSGIAMMLQHRVLHIDDPEIIRIQKEHDYWCDLARHQPDGSREVLAAETRFLQLVQP
jgi:hypothetical protein